MPAIHLQLSDPTCVLHQQAAGSFQAILFAASLVPHRTICAVNGGKEWNLCDSEWIVEVNELDVLCEAQGADYKEHISTSSALVAIRPIQEDKDVTDQVVDEKYCIRVLLRLTPVFFQAMWSACRSAETHLKLATAPLNPTLSYRHGGPDQFDLIWNVEQATSLEIHDIELTFSSSSQKQ